MVDTDKGGAEVEAVASVALAPWVGPRWEVSRRERWLLTPNATSHPSNTPKPKLGPAGRLRAPFLTPRDAQLDSLPGGGVRIRAWSTRPAGFRRRLTLSLTLSLTHAGGGGVWHFEGRAW
jgi:hypothetical protein